MTIKIYRLQKSEQRSGNIVSKLKSQAFLITPRNLM